MLKEPHQYRLDEVADHFTLWITRHRENELGYDSELDKVLKRIDGDHRYEAVPNLQLSARRCDLDKTRLGFVNGGAGQLLDIFYAATPEEMRLEVSAMSYDDQLYRDLPLGRYVDELRSATLECESLVPTGEWRLLTLTAADPTMLRQLFVDIMIGRRQLS